MSSIQQEYNNVTKKETVLKIDQDNTLPPVSCGGVELLAARGEQYF